MFVNTELEDILGEADRAYRGTVTALPWEDRGKLLKSSVKVAGGPADILTGHLPNTKSSALELHQPARSIAYCLELCGNQLPEMLISLYRRQRERVIYGEQSPHNTASGSCVWQARNSNLHFKAFLMLVNSEAA